MVISKGEPTGDFGQGRERELYLPYGWFLRCCWFTWPHWGVGYGEHLSDRPDFTERFKDLSVE